jgi:general L-amino acid transport system permease protein
MRMRGIQSGFDFLLDPAGFDISESMFAFTSTQTYGQAFLVGLLNTLRVSCIAIVICTLWGTLLAYWQTLQQCPRTRVVLRLYRTVSQYPTFAAVTHVVRGAG